MCNASSFVRIASGVVSCALAVLLAAAAPAQTIDLSLNLLYDDPLDLDSGGSWEVVAKSSGSGIAGLSLRLSDIESAVVFEAPRGLLNGSGAGFSILANSSISGGRNISLAQPTLPSGEPQRVFYGVGTIANGTPNDLTPAPGSFTNLQNVPWAPEPDPPGDPFDEMEWDIAATFASGSFADGDTPAFLAGSSGQIFTSVGSSTSYGSIAVATISTIVRTNLTVSPVDDPDYNDDGFVNAADYILWRHDPASFGGNPAGYNTWRNNYGQAAGAGASLSAAAAPEPASGLLLSLGATTLFFARRHRIRKCSGGPTSSIQHPTSPR